ncbi:MAG TPA: NAD-dependent epimerase/dehydratase family protein [Thermoleophilaceae bacterium]|nr:NAD-dependent epimerase/dehydratase family protein [Thermoleophilaceae bacterium]
MTGAQGFVGAWLAERLLADGEQVVVPRRDSRAESRFRTEGIEERCDVVDADVTDYEALVRVLHEYRVRSVFHLAGQSVTAVAGRSPYSTWESNLRGTYTLLEACRAAREVGEEIERVVVASSVLAYGGGAPPWREDAPLQPTAPYGASKAAADLVARSYAQTFELPVAVARLAHVYGGGDLEFSRLVPGACRALAAGERPVLRTDGSPVCEFLYVEDAVDAYLAIAASLDDPAERGRAWNAGGGEPLPVREIVARLARVAGDGVEPDVRGSGPGEGEARQELDSSAIRSELGWAPAWDLDRGLAATYEWYREHLDA